MVQYRVNYFNLRGRGEIVRYVLVAAGQQFEGKTTDESDMMRDDCVDIVADSFLSINV